jgi:hypothetical protein
MSAPDAPTRPSRFGRLFWSDPNTQFLLLRRGGGPLRRRGRDRVPLADAPADSTSDGDVDVVRGAEGLPDLGGGVLMPAAAASSAG